MTDDEKEFARQAAYLANVHGMANQAEELAGMGAPTLLFSAALTALNRLNNIDHAMDIARIWAESLAAQSVEREATH